MSEIPNPPPPPARPGGASLSLVGPDDRYAGLHLPLCALLLHPGVTLGQLFGRVVDSEDFEWWTVDLSARRPVLEPIDGPDDDAEVQIASRRRHSEPPSWLGFLRRIGLPLDGVAPNAHDSAVVAIRIGTGLAARTVLWCFGAVSRAMPTACTDSRFGLIVALNKHAAGDSVPPWRPGSAGARRRSRGDPVARVRGATHQVRDGYPHRATSRSPGPAPLEGLRFDTTSDLLHGLSVRTQDDSLRDLVGGRSLRLTAHLAGLPDLVDLSEHVLMFRHRWDYHRDWSWIDRFVPVEDEAELAAVLGELFDRLVSDDHGPADLVAPDMSAGEDTLSGAILYALPGQRPPYPRALTIDVLRDWLRRNGSRRGGAEVLRGQVRFRLEGHEQDKPFAAELLELLVAELDVGGQRYVVSDGEVLRIDSGFLEDLNARLEALVGWSDFPFPAYQGGTEPAYLDSAYARSGGRLLMLDQDPIRLPNETPFEVCDLLADDGRLVFGKLKGRSSLFSHLAVQVETAADLLWRESLAREAFRKAVLKRTQDETLLAAMQDVVEALERRQAGEMTLTMLLLGGWREPRSLAELPLVTRLRLLRTAQAVTGRGYRLEIAAPAFDPGSPPPSFRTRTGVDRAP